MLILPAIDLRGGKCVRLIQGDYGNERVYGDDPVAVARRFESEGADLLHVVDLDGARSGAPENLEIIAAIAGAVQIPVEVGGGIRSLETARRVLGLGVARVVVGTKLVQDEALAKAFFEELGEAVVAGIDARDGAVAVSGWREGTTLPAWELAQRVQAQGARRIILTDIGRDGMLTGPNRALYEQVAAAVDIPIVHSGGIGSALDVRALAGFQPKPEGAILGRALYEGRLSVQEAVTIAKLL